MKLASVASMSSEHDLISQLNTAEDVVEIGILLPANRAADLIQVARSRRESVGHLIRRLIDQELASVRHASQSAG